MGGTMRIRAWILVALAASFHSVVFAELPPSAYEEKQKAASEKLDLRVMRVEVEPGANPKEQVVRITAIVDKVDRTASGLNEGDFLTIIYTVLERPPGWVGPGAIPILSQKDKTVAYLQRIPDSRDYQPVAGAMSFSNF